ncbi:uncharacterized protein A4U43_C07F720 [Asparagus officinalis]|uniref:Bulb-type lectin domain-containing protein n=1 Tax=Asparagus officinalis TaxID=4686 RepID=A0A5P1E866_ASPOF|nr:mannose-specific lectin-like [Asparagus officinalis]ONK62136.1 uncharacterized protein A4U43_C07F720 [Asparagus officinalis]
MSTGTTKSSAVARPAIIDSTFWTDDNAPIGTIIENRDYKLVLQDNCNLTLSTADSSGEVLWFTDSKDLMFDCFVNLEANGELRVKYLGGVPLWGSGVTGPPNSDYVLTIRPEGKLAVYGPSLWSSTTNDGVAAAVAESYGEKKIAVATEE